MTQVHDWDDMAGALFGAALTAWILLLLASVSAKGPRPTPGPATLTPGLEAPAIVDLLVHGWKPTRAAPVATLLDLAARGHLHLVAEPSGRLICRKPSIVPSEPLAMYEQPLLQQVGGRLLGDSTPAAALLPDPEDEVWNATFRSVVGKPTAARAGG